jgi:hypothetical protein
MAERHIHRGLTDEWCAPAHQFVNQRAKGVDVAPRVELVTAEELRRRRRQPVGGLFRAHAEERGPQVLRAHVLQHDLQLRARILENQQVVGVQRAVTEPGGVQRRQRLDDRPEQRQEVVQMPAAAFADQLGEHLAFDVLVRDADQLALGADAAGYHAAREPLVVHALRQAHGREVALRVAAPLHARRDHAHAQIFAAETSAVHGSGRAAAELAQDHQIAEVFTLARQSIVVDRAVR